MQTDGLFAGCWLDDAPPGYGPGSGLMRTGRNEHGTPIGLFVCGTCHTEISVCPPPDYGDSTLFVYRSWRDCALRSCDSYDPTRDADIVFMSDAELAELPVVALNMLRARKSGLRRRAIADDDSTPEGGDRG